MRRLLWSVAVAAAAWGLAGCSQPVARVGVPAPNDPAAYVPQPMPKPMPGEAAPSAPLPPAPAAPSTPSEPLPPAAPQGPLPQVPAAPPGAGITPAPR